MVPELCRLTIAEASRLLSRKELGVVELTRAFLEHIQSKNSHIDSYIRVTEERALEDAARADTEIAAGNYRGPLHGIPIALKDLFETADIPTTAHSRVLLNNIPKQDATCVDRLNQAGAVLLGKLATHEFAFGGPSFDLPFPPARNPWNTNHFTGGSSTGSGAAVAAGLCMGALGTDGGGSIRIPAAYCGITGIKPTYGRVSRAGVYALAHSTDHAGPLTWTAEDSALILEVISGQDSRDPTSVNLPVPAFSKLLQEDLKGVRIGVIRHFYEEDERADDDVISAMNSAISVFRSLGASVEDVQLPPLQDFQACCMVILLTEAYALHKPWLQNQPENYGRVMREKLILGGVISATDYYDALRMRVELLNSVITLHNQYDVLLTASTFSSAPKLQETKGYVIFSRPLLMTPFNVTGTPAISICNGFTERNLPLGMQIAGRPFDEATVLSVAHAYERATPWRNFRPTLTV
tara:strand:- start:476 stop:1876 length:1401 start_codon:yes stop_codon:yes gene_type:complete